MFVLNILCTCRRLPSTLQPNTHLSNIKLFSTHNVFYTPRTRQVLPHTTQNISTSSITNNDNNSEQQKTNTTTVSNIELEKFKTLAPEWWKNDGEFIALKSLNKLRVPLIRNWRVVVEMLQIPPNHWPVSKFSMLDVVVEFWLSRLLVLEPT